MNAIVHRIVESNLSDFKGLSVESNIPVSEKIINDMIQLFLTDMQKSSPEQASEKNGQQTNESQKKTGDDSIDIRKILGSLDEKDVKVELREKQLVVKITARKY